MALLPYPSPQRLRPFYLALAGGLLCLSACEQPTPPVLRFNQAPKADAGSDIQGDAGGVVVLDGDQSSDPEGGDLVYAWIQVSGPAAVGIRNAGTSRAVFEAQQPGSYDFRLTVTDPEGASSTDEVRVVVAAAGTPDSPAYTAPVADAGADALVLPGEAVVLDGAGSVDLDGGALSYSWIQLDGPSLLGILEADGPRARVLPPQEGDYLFRLTVTDDEGTSAVDEVLVRVVAETPGPEPGEGNAPPLADAGADVETVAAEAVLLDGRQSADGDGDVLTFAWIQVAGPEPVAISAADTEVAHIQPTEPGVYIFRVIVIDADGATATDEVRLTVSPLPAPSLGSIEVEAVFGAVEAGGA